MKFSIALALAVAWVCLCIWIGCALFEFVIPAEHWTRIPVLMTLLAATVAGYVWIGSLGLGGGK